MSADLRIAFGRGVCGSLEEAARREWLVTDGMEQLCRELPRIGVRVHPSAGNFVLADTAGDGRAAYERLLRHGVIVRPMGGYGLPACLRITIGTAQQNDKLIRSLAAVMAGN